MKNVIDVLRDQYNATISQEDDWGFFSVLASYINYILETPTLRKITDEIMGKKQKEYDKLAKLEEKSLQELKQAENKLLKIVEKNNISHTSLTPDWSSIPNPPRMNTLETLKAFEEGHISISGFKSNNLEKFLFDIAASILKQGYQSELKDFLVLNEEYGLYYSKADGKISINSNTRGNFIFSNTLKLRREQSEFIEKTEKFELWGAFNALLKFQKAFLEKSKNKDFGYIVKKYSEGRRNSQEEDDVADILFFAQDLGEIAESKSSRLIDHRSRHHLKKDDFKNYASMVNAYLVKELAKTENKKETFKEIKIKEKIIIDLQRGIYNAAHQNLIYEISGKRLRIVDYLCKNNTASLLDLSACTGQVDYLIVKEIKEINNTFRKLLKTKKDLIIHSRTGGGYRLNRDDLDIKTST